MLKIINLSDINIDEDKNFEFKINQFVSNNKYQKISFI